MKLTIGGSYHSPGWDDVCKLIAKLEEAGHEILAPKAEWEPIYSRDGFVRFKGEEEMSAYDLQNGFFRKMEESDAYVICNSNGYMGFAVSIEFGYATQLLLDCNSNMKQMYFSEIPLGYNICKSMQIRGKALSVEEFKKELLGNSAHKNELSFFKKFLNGNGMISYNSVADFYSDIINMFVKISALQSKGLLTIGLQDLLKEKKSDKGER